MSEGKNTKHAELIARVRYKYGAFDQTHRDLADALEAADTRNAELEAERPKCDAGCITEPDETCSLHGRKVGEVWGIVADLSARLYGELAEHDRVIADEALGAALEAWRLGGSGDAYQWLSAYRTNHRANPEPKEGDRG